MHSSITIYSSLFHSDLLFLLEFIPIVGLEYIRPGGGGGGGGALRYRGGPHPRYVFRGRRGRFYRPPHVRDFVKEGYPGTKYGGQNPLTIQETYAALTPSDSRSDWASEFAAPTCCR